MKIEKVIKRFERLIPIYEEGIKAEEIPYNLRGGLCSVDYRLMPIFNKKTGYYKNYITESNGYQIVFLFPIVVDNYIQSIKIQKEKCLVPRLNFLKSEIKHLNSLLKKGYTDI